MDIFQMLKKDHRTVEALFARACKTSERGGKTRRELLARIRAELELHMVIEETILYPALKEEKLTEDLTLDAYAEHEAATDVLAKLEGMSTEDELWKAWLGVLKENVLHHAEEEETELFPKAKKALEKEQIQEMTARAQQMKRDKPPLRRTAKTSMSVARKMAAKMGKPFA